MAFTSEGLVVDRFNEQLAAIEADQRATIPQTITYENSNTIYQVNSVYARSADQVAQLVEAAFDTLKLGSAEGYHLEEIGRLRGVFRIPASPSNTNSQYVVMQPGAVIPAGSLFSAPDLNVTVTNPTAVTATTTSCAQATSVTSQANVGTTYGWSINGINYSYVAQGGDTIEDIHNELKSLLDADLNKTFTYTEQVHNSGPSRSFIFTANTGTTLNISKLTIYITIERVKVYFYVENIETGAVGISEGEVDTLLNPVVGFFETSNDDAFIIGREQETDTELRLRIQAGAVNNCTGTPDTIINSLLTNVQGVTFADITENLDYDTGFPTDAEGRPWLTYETLVLGGSNEDVAQDIWRTRPASAWTYGNLTLPVTDSSGEEKFVSFSRPSEVLINVVLQYDTSDSEFDFPSGGAAAMQAAIINYISALPIGKNVVANRLYGIAYNAIGGEGAHITSIQIERDDDPGLTSGFIDILSYEYSLATVASVTITNVTP